MHLPKKIRPVLNALAGRITNYENNNKIPEAESTRKNTKECLLLSIPYLKEKNNFHTKIN